MFKAQGIDPRSICIHIPIVPLKRHHLHPSRTAGVSLIRAISPIYLTEKSLANILFSPESISSTTCPDVHAFHDLHVSATTDGNTLFCSWPVCSIVLMYSPPLTCHAMWQWKGHEPELSVLYCRTMYDGFAMVPAWTNWVSRRCVFCALVIWPSHMPKPSASTLKLCPWRCIGWEAGKELYTTRRTEELVPKLKTAQSASG